MLLRLPIKFPRFIIFLVLFLTGLSIIPLLDLTPDNSMEIWFRPSDPVLQKLHKYQEAFGNDQSILVFYRTENLFTSEALALNRKLTNDLSGISNVRNATSITNVQTLSRNLIGPRIPVPLINQSFTNLEKAKQLVLNDELYRDNVISSDGRATTIILTKSPTDTEQSSKLLDDIRSVLAKKQYSENRYHIMGGLPIRVELNRISERESKRYALVTIITISFLLFMVFRSPVISLLPLLVGVISVIWSLSFYTLNGNRLNMISGLIPPIVLFASIACSIHIISHYLDKVSHATLNRSDAIGQVMKKLVTPCFFSSLTTIAALLSFTVSDTPPIQKLAIYASFGVGISFVLSFSFLPAVLALNKQPVGHYQDSFICAVINSVLGRLVKFIEKFRRRILFFFGFIVAFCLLGLINIRFESNQVEFLKGDSPTRVAYSRMTEWFSGVYPVELVLQSEESGYFFSTEGVELIRKVAIQVAKEREVKKTMSIFTFYESYYQAMTGAKLEHVVQKTGDVEAVLNLLGKSFGPARKYISSDGKTTRINARCKWLDATEVEELLARFNNNLAKMCQDRGVSLDFSGPPIMVINLKQSIIKSLIGSLAISFAVIFLMLCLLFRKIKISAMGMVPNVLPIIISIGLMSWFGLKMDVATILIAATTLGISVDDTIHFLFFYNKNNTGKETRKVLLEKVIAYVGLPIILTSFFLASGFSLMFFSSFRPVLYFGSIVSLSVIMALVCDLVLLPSLLMNNRKRSAP